MALGHEYTQNRQLIVLGPAASEPSEVSLSNASLPQFEHVLGKEAPKTSDLLWGGQFSPVAAEGTNLTPAQIVSLNEALLRAWKTDNNLAWIPTRVRCEILRMPEAEYCKLVGIAKNSILAKIEAGQELAAHPSTCRELILAWGKIADAFSTSVATKELLRDAGVKLARAVAAATPLPYDSKSGRVVASWILEHSAQEFENKTGLRFAERKALLSNQVSIYKLCEIARQLDPTFAVSWMQGVPNHIRGQAIYDAICSENQARGISAAATQLLCALLMRGSCESSSPMDSHWKELGFKRKSDASAVADCRIIPYASVLPVIDGLFNLGVFDHETGQGLKRLWREEASQRAIASTRHVEVPENEKVVDRAIKNLEWLYKAEPERVLFGKRASNADIVLEAFRRLDDCSLAKLYTRTPLEDRPLKNLLALLELADDPDALGASRFCDFDPKRTRKALSEIAAREKIGFNALENAAFTVVHSLSTVRQCEEVGDPNLELELEQSDLDLDDDVLDEPLTAPAVPVPAKKPKKAAKAKSDGDEGVEYILTSLQKLESYLNSDTLARFPFIPDACAAVRNAIEGAGGKYAFGGEQRTKLQSPFRRIYGDLLLYLCVMGDTAFDAGSFERMEVNRRRSELGFWFINHPSDKLTSRIKTGARKPS